MSRLPSVGPDTARTGCLSGRPGETIAALLHQFAATGDQELVTCGLASFRGRAARGVSANSAR
jgi:hypothetical protein